MKNPDFGCWYEAYDDTDIISDVAKPSECSFYIGDMLINNLNKYEISVCVYCTDLATVIAIAMTCWRILII